MRRLVPLIALLATAALPPAVAPANTVPVPPPPPPPAPAPAPGPAPITIHTTLENPGGLPVDTVIAGGQVRVVGTVTPYIAGQTVFVRTFRYGARLDTRNVPVRNGGHGVGRFTAVLGVGGRPAPIIVRVAHPATSFQAGSQAPVRRLLAVRAGVVPGQQGAAVRLLQQELAGLHYAVPRSGRYDDGTARAVIAFRKLTDLARTPDASRIVFDRLAIGAGSFHVRYPGQGSHFEGDLTHQVLAEVLPGGRVRQIFEMSSGKPSTPTVIGNFNVYLKTAGINEKGMVDANYFIRGYAIHGYADVPPYPASHGCLRIPVPDAAGVFAWARYGYPVDVYYRSGGGSHQIRGNAGP
ncbi:MAG: L,D-transpeptidase family protein [Solirubrobacteraceae bacterium]